MYNTVYYKYQETDRKHVLGPEDKRGPKIAIFEHSILYKDQKRGFFDTFKGPGNRI